MTHHSPTLVDLKMTNKFQFNSQAPDLLCMAAYPNKEKIRGR